MKDNNDIISLGQMIFILMLTMVGTGILGLPRSLAEAVPYDHWAILVFGGFVCIIAVLSHGAIIRLRPQKQYFQILSDALSKPIAYIVGFAYVLYFVIFIGFVTRIFGEVIKVFLLIHTPIEVINVSILASSIYLVRKGVEVLGRMLEFLFPVLILFGIFAFSLSFTGADAGNLLPIFQIKFMDILKGAPITILSFVGFEMLLFFGAHLEEPKKATKSYIAVVAVLLFYLLIILAIFAQFGPMQVKYLLWSTLDLFDTIELPGMFVENIQVIIMSIWVLLVFTTITPMHLAATTMLKSLTNSKDQAYLAALFLPFIYFVSIIPDSVSETYHMIDLYTRYVSSTLVFIIPLIVLISLFIQEKMRKGVRSNA